MNGLLVLDKPGGMTSREALNRVQRWFPRRTKIGHTGTLDPLATGVLVVCIGAATRLAEYVQAMDKSYDSRFRLGATSTTDDADGEVLLNEAIEPPGRAAIDAALESFVGTIEQLPPTVSALMVDGRRAHSRARSGETISLAPRPVTVDAIRVHRYEWPVLEVSVECGKGTYIRSIARDLGAKLGTGGLVETLRRTRVGPFRADDGVGLDWEPAAVHAKIQPPITAVADKVRVTINPFAEMHFRRGEPIDVPGEFEPLQEVAVLDERGEFVGIGVNDRGLRPRIVMAITEPRRA